MITSSKMKDWDMSDYWLQQGLKHGSRRSLLLCAEIFIEGDNPTHQVDIETAVQYLKKFRQFIDYKYADELDEYEQLKEYYGDLLPWDDIESHPYDCLDTYDDEFDA